MLVPVTWLVWLLPAAFALVDWWAVWRADRRTETWAKPATLVALIVAALVLGAAGSGAGLWLLVALAFGLVGDVLLLDKGERRFRLGLAAFLVGHLAYVVSFTRLGLHPRGWSWEALLVLGACLVATRQVPVSTYVRGGRRLAVPVAVYTVVIGAMVIVAFDTGLGLVAIGATVFAASDTLLARDRFIRPVSWAPVAVMVSYHIGQALIVAGVLAT